MGVVGRDPGRSSLDPKAETQAGTCGMFCMNHGGQIFIGYGNGHERLRRWRWMSLLC